MSLEEASLLGSLGQVQQSLVADSLRLRSLGDALEELSGAATLEALCQAIPRMLCTQLSFQAAGFRLNRRPAVAVWWPSEQSGPGEEEGWSSRLLEYQGQQIAQVWLKGQGACSPQVLDRYLEACGLALRNALLAQSIAEHGRELEAKAALLQEMHHRIKNNLQMIASLLAAQRSQERSESARRALENGIRRVKSVAAVHDLLSQELEGWADAAALIERVVQEAVRGQQSVAACLELDRVSVRSGQAVALALAVNELVTNCLRHAFPDGRGQIAVRMASAGGRVQVEVADDGQGLPVEVAENRRLGLGLTVVSRLVQRELGGRITLLPGPGARVTIEFENRETASDGPAPPR